MAAIYAKSNHVPDDQSNRKPRTLSEKQLRLPFFRAALKTMQSVSSCRKTLLPRLLYKSNSGRKTRKEIYEALEKAAEPILVRLDLATGVLGWLDGDGQFRLNNQKGIAADAGLSNSSLNRLINTLVDCGYVQKRSEKISVKDRKHGISLVRTRVFIRLTGLFFRHLGISLRFGIARKHARKRRNQRLSEIQQKNIASALAVASRKRKKQKAKEVFEKRQQVNDDHQNLELNRARQVRWVELKIAYPEATNDEIALLLKRELG